MIVFVIAIAYILFFCWFLVEIYFAPYEEVHNEGDEIVLTGEDLYNHPKDPE